MEYFETHVMEDIAYCGFLGHLTKRLTGRSFVSEPAEERFERTMAMEPA